MSNVEVIFENRRLEKMYEKYSKNDPLRKKIDKIILEIKKNPAYGKQIPNNRLPKEYVKRGFNNAFWVRINDSWRLIYSLTGDNVEIIAIILDYFDHKKYERKFKYN